MSAPVRVLVVDDQATVRHALVTLLGAGSGAVVVGTAADGAAGVAAARRCRPDVVVMDLRMPVLDGVAATRALAAAEPAVAVVVLTTDPTDPLLEAALDAGAVGWLAKEAGAEEIALAVATANGSDRIVGGWFALGPLSAEWTRPFT